MNQQFCSLTLSVDLIELQLSLRYQSSDEERWEVGAIWRQEWIHFTKLFNFWNNEYSWKLVPLNWGDLCGPKDSSDDLSTDCNFLAINWSFTGLEKHNVYFDIVAVWPPRPWATRGQESENQRQATPGEWPEPACLAPASVRMMFPPPSPQLYNVYTTVTTHQNKLPMSSTWRKYW